jgi:exosome complex RNA-binding protein Rrp4
LASCWWPARTSNRKWCASLARAKRTEWVSYRPEDSYFQCQSTSLDCKSSLNCCSFKIKRSFEFIQLPFNPLSRLLKSQNKLLQNLGTRFKFECAIGLNGKVWIKGTSLASTIYIVNAIKQIAALNEKEMEKHCENVLETFVMIK